jgi:hypothetical protein
MNHLTVQTTVCASDDRCIIASATITAATAMSDRKLNKHM